MHYQFPFNQACKILLTQQYCVGVRIYQYVKSFECVVAWTIIITSYNKEKDKE